MQVPSEVRASNRSVVAGEVAHVERIVLALIRIGDEPVVARGIRGHLVVLVGVVDADTVVTHEHFCGCFLGYVGHF